jgi:hypothetical protein
METEGIHIRHVDTSIKPNEAMGFLRPPQGCGAIEIVKVFFGDQVAWDSCEDVLVRFFDIHKNDTMHDRRNIVSNIYRCSHISKKEKIW